MQDKIPAHQEHASASAEAAWKFHTDAPVLGEIDRAIAQGGAAGAGAGDAAGERAGNRLGCCTVLYSVVLCCSAVLLLYC